ncbi:MAG: YIP1 family protein [Marinosulfonomonas sp.]|nr:MAG: YIP1 family protein [Marinosulfonomonas sp.]
MSLNLASLIKDAVDTIRDPREGARKVMAREMERRQRWETLLLIAVLSAVFAFISISLSTNLSDAQLDDVARMNPFVLGLSQIFVLVVMVFAIHLIGGIAGGEGSLDDAILLVAWLQFVLICLQVLQIIAAVVMPFVAVVIGLVGLFVVFRLLTVFVAELHGFRSTVSVFIAVLVVMIVLATVISLVFGAFGIDMMGVL